MGAIVGDRLEEEGAVLVLRAACVPSRGCAGSVSARYRTVRACGGDAGGCSGCVGRNPCTDSRAWRDRVDLGTLLAAANRARIRDALRALIHGSKE